MISKAALVAALEKRFDYFSSRVILRETLGKAELADKDWYGESDVALFLAALKTSEKRIEKVIAHLASPEGGEAATESAPVAAVVAAPEPVEPVVEAAPAVEETPAAEAAVTEEAPAEPQADAEPQGEAEPQAEADHGDRHGGGKKKKR